MSRVSTARRQRLVQLLQTGGEMSVSVLCKGLDVSEATVRRDLATLEAVRKVTRSLSGARLVEEASLVNRTFAEKRELMRAEKERIAEAAADMVRPGMVIALDSGTTTWRLATRLKDKGPLTVLTAAISVVEELAPVAGIQLFVTGGQLRPTELDFVGPHAAEAFIKLHADIAFLSVDSLIVGKGCFASDHESATIVAAMAACAEQRVIVADHTKLNAKGSYLSVYNHLIDCVITTTGMPDTVRDALELERYQKIIV